MTWDTKPGHTQEKKERERQRESCKRLDPHGQPFSSPLVAGNEWHDWYSKDWGRLARTRCDNPIIIYFIDSIRVTCHPLRAFTHACSTHCLGRRSKTSPPLLLCPFALTRSRLARTVDIISCCRAALRHNTHSCPLPATAATLGLLVAGWVGFKLTFWRTCFRFQLIDTHTQHQSVAAVLEEIW